MSKINELRAKKKTVVQAMAAISILATVTEAQAAEFSAKEREANEIQAQIERLETTERLQAGLDTVPATPRPAPEGNAAPKIVKGRRVIENPGFSNVGEIMLAAYVNRSDRRVVALMEANTGTSGGIPIPDEINPMLREVTPQEAIWRPRATVVPAGDAPDAALTMPALNQGSSANMYGGVEVQWTSEGATVGDTNGKLRDISWQPKEITGSITVTAKLLRNWAAAGALIDRLLRGAMLAAEDVAFMSGNGVGRPLGVLKSPALKKVNRTTANQVKYLDLVGMEAELHEDAPAVWIINPRVIPQLRKMVDGANQYIWVDNARDGAGAMLLGKPVIKNYRSPALGSLGDVLLAVPPHYVIKDGVSLQLAASEHVKFQENKIVVKAVASVDGAPWLDAPILQEDGQTYSPFVALDVPA